VKTIRIQTAALLLLPLLGCQTAGTLMSVTSRHVEVLSASDQAVLADAIDEAFDKADVEALRTKLRDNGKLTAYLEVAAPFPVSEATLNYVSQHASVIAGRVGIQLMEVVRTLERPLPEHPAELIQTNYPNTDARVVVLVSYVGVDREITTGRHRSHGTSEPDFIYHGRFRGRLAVIPRTASFAGASVALDGSSAYEVVEGDLLIKH
jgi:hypothetical protein